MTDELLSPEIEAALAGLTDPTTAPALAGALGYGESSAVSLACRTRRIPGAFKVGGIWLIPLHSVREALQNGKLRPRNWSHQTLDK